MLVCLIMSFYLGMVGPLYQGISDHVVIRILYLCLMARKIPVQRKGLATLFSFTYCNYYHLFKTYNVITKEKVICEYCWIADNHVPFLMNIPKIALRLLYSHSQWLSTCWKKLDLLTCCSKGDHTPQWTMGYLTKEELEWPWYRVWYGCLVSDLVRA